MRNMDNELICAVADHYLRGYWRLAKVEDLLRRFVLAQARQEPSLPGLLSSAVHRLCKAAGQIPPRAMMNVLEGKLIFVEGPRSHECYGGMFPAMGYKGGSEGMCEVELTDPVAAKFDEMLWSIRSEERRSNAEPAVGPAAYRKKVLDDAAGGGDRPGDRGDQLHVAARVDRAERAAASKARRKDSAVGRGKAAGRTNARPSGKRARHAAER